MARTKIAALKHNYSPRLTLLPACPAACQLLKEKAAVGTAVSKPISEVSWPHPAMLLHPRNLYMCNPAQLSGLST